MNFKQKLILMKTFVESQFGDMYVDDFETKSSSYQDI